MIRFKLIDSVDGVFRVTVEKKIKGKGIMNPQVKENQRKFPAGIRVLVVDDDETCLLWVENLLLTCNFKGS